MHRSFSDNAGQVYNKIHCPASQPPHCFPVAVRWLYQNLHTVHVLYNWSSRDRGNDRRSSYRLYAFQNAQGHK